MERRIPAVVPDGWRHAWDQQDGVGVKDQKALGIGFHKTGTSTLKSAVSTLGYTFASRFHVDGEIVEDALVTQALAIAGTVDAVQDNPWPLLYQDLDIAFPGSRFILTTRDTDEWWESLLRHFGGKSTEMRRWIYGVGDPRGQESLYKDRYEAHNAAVIEYFADRPDDLLVLAITDGEGWDRLCPFLGEPKPEAAFPHRVPRPKAGIGARIGRRLRGA